MKPVFTIMFFILSQCIMFGQCENTNLNPTEDIIPPIFGEYQMTVANDITPGDYFNLAFLSDLHTLTFDVKIGNPLYIHIYVYNGATSQYILIADGPTPLTADLNDYSNYQIHVNTVTPLCGTNSNTSTITIECETCPPHQGVGINTSEVDPSAALHIDGSQGGLLLPQHYNTDVLPNPKRGLLFFNYNNDNLEFYNGQDWVNPLTISTSSSHLDFKKFNNNTAGTDGTYISIFNTSNISGTTAGLRLFNGNDEYSSSSAILYRNGKIHFAQKGSQLNDIISINDSFLEMDGDKMIYTGTSNTGLEIRTSSINSQNTFSINELSEQNIRLSPFGGQVMIASSTILGNSDLSIGGKTYIDDDLIISEKSAIGAEIIDVNATLKIQGEDNNGNQATLKISSGNQDMLLDGNELDSSSDLYLQNNSTNDIVLVNGGGKVGVNWTSPAAMLDIKQLPNGEEALRIINDSDNDDWALEIGNEDLRFFFNTTIKASINDANGAWTQTSDRTLKKDIEYDQRTILNDLLELKPASYRYLDNSNDSKKSYGFIAQEVQDLFPELINDEEGEYLSISYSEFSVLAIKAIQEQQLIIQTLEEKYESLLKRIEKLEE